MGPLTHNKQRKPQQRNRCPTANTGNHNKGTTVPQQAEALAAVAGRYGSPKGTAVPRASWESCKRSRRAPSHCKQWAFTAVQYAYSHSLQAGRGVNALLYSIKGGGGPCTAPANTNVKAVVRRSVVNRVQSTQCTVYRIQSTQCTEYRVHNVQSTEYTVYRIHRVQSVQSTEYTVYRVQC